jgi:hypothetical protein
LRRPGPSDRFFAVASLRPYVVQRSVFEIPKGNSRCDRRPVARPRETNKGSCVGGTRPYLARSRTWTLRVWATKLRHQINGNRTAKCRPFGYVRAKLTGLCPNVGAPGVAPTEKHDGGQIRRRAKKCLESGFARDPPHLNLCRRRGAYFSPLTLRLATVSAHTLRDTLGVLFYSHRGCKYPLEPCRKLGDGH